MKNNWSEINKLKISTFKKKYYITLENAGKRTQECNGNKSEGISKRQYDFDD